MEEKTVGEQPEIVDTNVQREIVEEVNTGTALESQNDGSLGKFKDAESMLEAYNNLQAEFTRKCQKLSEVTKSLEELENAKNENVEQTPIFSNENWKENVSAFLQKNSEAEEYSGAICEEILNDKNLQMSPNALELAWARIMKREFASPKTLAHDQNFINEQILSQEQVKKQVLEEYFKNLQNLKTPPVIAKAGNVAFKTEKGPTNMQEAKQMVEKLFNLKG